MLTNFSRNKAAAAGGGFEFAGDAQVLGPLLLKRAQRLDASIGAAWSCSEDGQRPFDALRRSVWFVVVS